MSGDQVRYDLVVRSRRTVLPDGTRAAAVAGLLLLILPIDPEPFLARTRVVQVDVVAGRGDRFAVGGKGDAPDVLAELGGDVQLLAGSDLKKMEPTVAPSAAGKFCPVVRERERSNGSVEFVPDRKSP